MEDITKAVELGLGSQSYGDFYRDSRQYDIIGAVGYENRATPAALSRAQRAIPQARCFRSITSSRPGKSPRRLRSPRYNRFSAATISAGLAPGKTVGDGVGKCAA